MEIILEFLLRDLEVRLTPKLTDNHSSVFAVGTLVEKDTPLVCLAHLMGGL